MPAWRADLGEQETAGIRQVPWSLLAQVKITFTTPDEACHALDSILDFIALYPDKILAMHTLQIWAGGWSDVWAEPI